MSEFQSASLWGWGGIAALLFLEMVVLTLRFDSETFAKQGSWWTSILVYARYLPQGLVAVAAAALVLADPQRRFAFRRRSEFDPSSTLPPHSRLFYLSGHLIAFACFLLLTQSLWEGSLRHSPYAPLWTLVWFLDGLVATSCLLAVVLPPYQWVRLVRDSGFKVPLILGFGITVCVAGRVTGLLSAPLHAATFRLVELLLRIGFHDLEVDRAKGIIGTSEFAVEIAPECSGYEGIGLIWVFLAVYLWIFRRNLRFPGALWLLPIGTVVIWSANVLRIAALVVIGTKVSSKVALGGFHSQAGWLAFNAVALGLVFFSRKARLFALDPDDKPLPAQTVNPTVSYLCPMLALVAALMLSTALSTGKDFDFSYPLRVVAVGSVLFYFRHSYTEIRLSISWQSIALGGVVFILWTTLESFHQSTTAPNPEASNQFLSGLSSIPRPLGGLWLVFRVLGSVVTVPIAEELAFRGYLSRRLLSSDFSSVPPGKFSTLSFLISSALFGVFHGRWLAGTLAGMVYAYAYRRKGNLIDPIVAHATTNALIAIQVLMTGAWSLWL